MDYNALLDMATDLGYELAMCGAETFRVEESVTRVIKTYGVESEVFSIPNCLIVSLETPDGESLTRMRRIGYHGNDLDGVEVFNAVSRAICNRTPAPQDAKQWLKIAQSYRKHYSLPLYLLGDFLAAFGFALFFGAGWLDSVFAGLCGITIGLISKFMDRMKVNQFFSTILSSFAASLAVYALSGVDVVSHTDAAVIGLLMLLVPGLLFTNAMRDIIYGDTNSGVNRIVQVLLIALAIALGTAAAWSVSSSLWSHQVSAQNLSYSPLLQCCVTFIGCIGFAVLFNVHGMGIWLCALGGFLTWAVYLLAERLGCDIIGCNFWAAFFAAAYAEIMARIRKYPAISYLVVSLFPLLPGAGIYYTMSYALDSQMNLALHKGLQTVGIAGVIAVGILLVSTAVRLINVWRSQKHI